MSVRTVRQRLIFVGLVLGLLALLMACADTGTPAPTTYRAANPVVFTTPNPTADAATLNLYLTAAAADGQAIIAQQTAEAARAGADAFWAQATAQMQMTAGALAFRATSQALDALATAQASTSTAAAQAYHSTSTAEAFNWTSTATSAAQTSTAQAARDAASATAQAYWNGVTVTAQTREDDRLSTAQAVQATLTAGVLEQERMALERERLLQPVKTWGPWLLVLAGLVGIGYLLYRAFVIWELRQRLVQRDLRGDAPLLIAPRRNGGYTIVDADRGTGPVITEDGQGNAAVPQLASPEMQERTTARDQAIDLTHRGLPGQPRAAMPRRSPSGMMPPPPQAPASSPYRILAPGEVPQIVDAEMVRVLDRDWKEQGND